MRNLEIDGIQVDDSSKPFVIAEVGHNHQGSLAIALDLIRAAAYSGASAVKFQKRSNRDLFTQSAFDAPYNSENAYGATYGLHREALEFGEKEYLTCIEEAKRCGIAFFSTAFDFESADFLAELNVPAFKLASGDLQSLPLIEYIAKIGKPMIISTGGADLQQVDDVVSLVKSIGTPFAILQCTAGYPPKYDELNLSVISRYRERYEDVVIGYSGHDNGIAMSLVAYTLGARIIEKHFTLDRSMKGTDHSFSLEPQGLRKLIRDLDRARLAMGDGEKRKYESESLPLQKMGKMIVANTSLPAGHILEYKNLAFKSPANGLAPSKFKLVIGRKLKVGLERDEPITFENLDEI